MTQDSQPQSAPANSHGWYVPPTPEWGPLESILGPRTCADFMAMGEIIQDSTTIYLYKHRDTRRYLNLDSQGQAYGFIPQCGTSSYKPIPLEDAITHAFT